MRHTWLLAVAMIASPVGAIGAQQPSLIERLRAAMQLPAIVDSVKKNSGMPEREVNEVIAEIKRRRMPASEARDVLQEANAAIRDHGPLDNFGAFVKARLDAGLRGRALAQAIRQEHARRGIGKGRTRGSMARSRDDSISRGQAKAGGGGAAKRPTTPAKGRSADTTKGKGKGRP
jgi:hypothetical protein